MTGNPIGPYRILGEIGKGGMGEVYRARDPRLGRDVAIKILPAAFITDRDRLARFEREARALASFNHPNIASIYGIEDADGSPALIMELVEGDTLADVVRRGPLPVARALRIAVQIAEALDSAHDKGIIHRDLKPANIKVTPDGTVKVLDFGLAKAMGPAGSAAPGPAAPSQSPTVAPSARTDVGVVLGTAAYMSPEQARGHDVDRRTDIWAFGCVLFEMLTGRVAFERPTATDTLAAILERDPDWSALPATTPAAVRRILRRCLEKDARRRMRDIGDARFELDDAVVEPPAVAEPHRSSSRRWLPMAAALAVAAIGIAAGALLGLRPAPDVGLPEMRVERVTSDPGLTDQPALSPDGRLIAYASDRAGGNRDIWVQQTSGTAPLRITDDAADDEQPSFSPDGNQIAFRSGRNGGGIYVVPALGGQARLIAEGGRNPRFSPDGQRIAYWAGQFRGTPSETPSAVYLMSLAGGEPARLLADFEVAREPVWAPDGRSLLVLGRRDNAAPLASDFDLWWVPLEGRAPVRTGLLDLHDLRTAADAEVVDVGAWTSDGVLIASGAALWLIPVSATNGTLLGPGRQLTLGAGRVSTPTASRDGQILFSALTTQRVIERLGLRPADMTIAAQRLYADSRPTVARASVSRDGATIVFERASTGSVEIWRRHSRTGQQQIVLTQAIEAGAEVLGLVNASVSPDGQRIGYTTPSNPSGGQRLESGGFVVAVDRGVPREICKGCDLYAFMSDSQRAVVVFGEKRISAIDIESGMQYDAIIGAAGERLDRPSVSPDDRWIAYRRGRGTENHVFVAKMTPGRPVQATAGEQVDEPTTTGRPCGWAPDSSVLYLLLDTDGSRDIWGQRVDQDSGRLVGKPFLVRHLHDKRFGVSTSYGNAMTDEGFVYETMVVTGNIWRLVKSPVVKP